MTEQEKLSLLEEIMDLDEGTLKTSDSLSNYVEWDSVSRLSFISIIEEKFKKSISGQEVRGFKTVADAIAVMG